jgi:hypothetical protein
MNIRKSFIVTILLLLISGIVRTQDVRTTDTKVADLLAQLPSTDKVNTDKLVSQMLSLGDAALKKICDQIIPAGSGDDNRPRFAVESISRYLSQYGKDSEKLSWEQICISYATTQKDYSVKDFFIK